MRRNMLKEWEGVVAFLKCDSLFFAALKGGDEVWQTG